MREVCGRGASARRLLAAATAATGVIGCGPSPHSGALLIALSRVSGSLRDGHLGFTPTGGWRGAGIAVLPLAFSQTGGALEPQFIIRRANPATGLLPGDRLERLPRRERPV